MLKKIAFIVAAAMCTMTAASAAENISNGGFEVTPFGGGFEIGTPIHSVGQNRNFGDIEENEIIETSLSGSGALPQDAVALFILKDSVNCALDMSFSRVQKTGNDFSFSSRLTAPKKLKKGEYRLSTYLWNGLSCREILADGFEFSNGSSPLVHGVSWNGIEKTARLSSAEKKSGYTSLCISPYGGETANVTNTVAIENSGVKRFKVSAKGTAAFRLDISNANGETLGGREFTPDEQWNDVCGAVFGASSGDEVTLSISGVGDGGETFIDDAVITDELIDSADFTLSGQKKTGSFEVIPLKRYTFSFNSNGSPCTAYIKSGNDIIAYKTSDSAAEKTEFDFYPTEGQNELSYCIFTDGTAQVSNVSAKEISRNIIINGNFDDYSEESGFYGWKVEDRGTLCLTEGYDGQNAVMMKDRGNAWKRIAQPITEGLKRFSIEGDLDYKVSGWVKYDVADMEGGVPMSMVIRTDDQTQTAIHIDNAEKGILQNVGNEWQYFENEINIQKFNKNDAAAECVAATFYLESGSNAGAYKTANICLDDIKVEALGDAMPITYAPINDLSVNYAELGN